MSAGNYIKNGRFVKGITQERLAAMVGVRQSRISQIEKDSRPAGRELAERIAKALGLDTDKIAGCERASRTLIRNIEKLSDHQCRILNEVAKELIKGQEKCEKK